MQRSKSYKRMLEIERKFLVDRNKWKPAGAGEKIMQGYLSTDKERVVRIRIKEDKAYLTIKGKTKGIVRSEFEYDVPVKDACEMMKLSLDNPIEKTRYKEKIGGLTWEIDIFHGINDGLCLAEVELEDENQAVEIPEWTTEEVSHDKRYFNAWLSQHPYSTW